MHDGAGWLPAIHHSPGRAAGHGLGQLSPCPHVLYGGRPLPTLVPRPIRLGRKTGQLKDLLPLQKIRRERHEVQRGPDALTLLPPSLFPPRSRNRSMSKGPEILLILDPVASV